MPVEELNPVGLSMDFHFNGLYYCFCRACIYVPMCVCIIRLANKCMWDYELLIVEERCKLINLASLAISLSFFCPQRKVYIFMYVCNVYSRVCICVRTYICVVGRVYMSMYECV